MAKEKENSEIQIGEVALFCLTQGKALLSFDVKVVDKIRQYGHERYLIEPVSGSGQALTQKLVPKK